MLKLLADAVFSFDAEWIPDPKSAEILHETAPADGPGDEARVSFEALWTSARKEGQAEDFQPYLKTILCGSYPWREFSARRSGRRLFAQARFSAVDRPIDSR